MSAYNVINATIYFVRESRKKKDRRFEGRSRGEGLQQPLHGFLGDEAARREGRPQHGQAHLEQDFDAFGAAGDERREVVQHREQLRTRGKRGG